MISVWQMCVKCDVYDVCVMYVCVIWVCGARRERLRCVCVNAENNGQELAHSFHLYKDSRSLSFCTILLII